MSDCGYYKYLSSEDCYVLYYSYCGGAIVGSFEKKLEKAIRTKGEIKLYEIETLEWPGLDEDGKVDNTKTETQTNTMIYIFKKKDDYYYFDNIEYKEGEKILS